MRRFNAFINHGYAGMGGLGREAGEISSVSWQPLVDIYERDDAVIIIVELPGVDKTRTDVSVDGELLKVSGFRPKQIPETTRHVHQMEIPYGHFTRIIRLSSSCDVDNIEAEYEHGYLTITIPRNPSK